jgi:WD40 repeat protein
MRIAKLLGIGAAIAILFLAAGNFGQVGLSQGQIPPVRTLGFGGVASVVFSPDGRYLAVGTWGGSSVQLIDTSIWQVIRTFEGHTDGVLSVAFSPDGRLLASGSRDRTIKLWEVATGQEVRSLKGHTDDVESVAFSPDGRLLASGSIDDTIKLWDISDLLGR